MPKRKGKGRTRDRLKKIATALARFSSKWREKSIRYGEDPPHGCWNLYDEARDLKTDCSMALDKKDHEGARWCATEAEKVVKKLKKCETGEYSYGEEHWDEWGSTPIPGEPDW